MLELKKEHVKEIGEELLGFSDFKIADVEKYFQSLNDTNINKNLAKIESQGYVDSVTYLRDILNSKVSRNLSVLEQFFIDKRLPIFLKKYQSQGPLVFQGRTLVAYDDNNTIKERVFIETDHSTTGEKVPDLIEVYIERPRELKTGSPILFVANPYVMGTNKEAFNEENLHDVVEKDCEPITEYKLKPDYKKVGEDGVSYRKVEKVADKVKEAKFVGIEHRNVAFRRYLAKGYALVYYAGRGAYFSQGYNVSGSPLELDAVDSFLRWVDGDSQGFYDLEGKVAVKCDWSNGSVGMSGASYLGTLQIGVSTITNSKSLKTIVPECGISNWYDYYRYNGLVVAPDGYLGEDIDILTWYCESFLLNPTNTSLEKEARFKEIFDAITHDMDRNSGQYNDFWAIRNYLPVAGNIRVPVLIVHGTEDWNVKISQLFKLMDATAGKTYEEDGVEKPVQRNFVIHRGKHVSIQSVKNWNYFGLLDRWLDYHLLEVGSVELENGQGYVQDNLDPDNWQLVDYDKRTSKAFRIEDGALELVESFDKGVSQVEDSYSTAKESKTVEFSNRVEYDSISQWEEILLNPNSEISLHYISKPLENDLNLHADLKLTLEVKSSRNVGALSAMIIDVGEDVRLNPNLQQTGEKEQIGMFEKLPLTEFKFEEEATSYKIITRGWVNLKNPVKESEDKNLYSFDLVPTDYKVRKGHKLLLVIYGADYKYTLRPEVSQTYTVNENSIQLHLDIR